MEENKPKKELEVNLSNVLVLILGFFAIIGVISLIWALWRTFQVCATFVFVIGLVLIFVPEKYLH